MSKRFVFAITAVCMVIAFAFTGCDLTVNDPIRNVPIFSPYISTQPKSYSFPIDSYVLPELETVIFEWEEKLDGQLSFEWYTFRTIEQFMKGDAVLVPESAVTTETNEDGDITTKISLSITDPAIGDKFYYYVEITNTNEDAIGDKSSTIRSDVAAISFYDEGEYAAAFPVITMSPAGTSYIMGRSAAVAPLEVRAESDNGGIQYQWFAFKTADGYNASGVPNGTPIQGQLTRTYLPVLTDLNVGDNYFYAMLTNVLADQGGTVIDTAVSYTMPVKIEMLMGEKAEAPRINSQPKGIVYVVGENLSATGVSKLSVGSVSIDGGQLSWQWQKNVTGIQEGKTPPAVGWVDVGTNSSEFLPDISTASAGIAFYRVVVTNTNQYVQQGHETAVITSSPALVKVQAAGSSVTPNAIVEFDLNDEWQFIRGYGGMETTWGNFFQSNDSDMELMFSPDYLGYNMWRIMIPPISTNIEENIAEIVSRSYADRYYRNPQIVNSYNGYVMASPWSMPKEWKSNNSINSGGHLIYRYYKQYAAYLRAYARHMANNGAPIYAISIQNEPNYAGGYDGCEWEPKEMMNFFREVGRFTQGVRGFGGGKVIPTVLTVNGESANNPNINHAAMEDPIANAGIDLFARHVYGEQTASLWGHPNLLGREVWMTEHNINSASEPAYPQDSTWNFIWRFMNDVDLVIRLNNENAFVWWVVKRFYSFIGEGAASTTDGSILPRGWGMAHYSKFTIDKTRVGVKVTGSINTAAGATVPIVFGGNSHHTHNGFLPGIAGSLTARVDAANVNHTDFDLDNPSARVTAFKSQDGNELSVILWTPTLSTAASGPVLGNGGYEFGDVQIRMPDGFKIRSASAMRSTALNGNDGKSRNTQDMGVFENVNIAADRESAIVNLPRSQILSVKFIKE